MGFLFLVGVVFVICRPILNKLKLEGICSFVIDVMVEDNYLRDLFFIMDLQKWP